MPERKSWIAEMDRIVKERNGHVTEDDEKYISDLIKIPNGDVLIKDVTFRYYKDYSF